jgi:hypothetical protein
LHFAVGLLTTATVYEYPSAFDDEYASGVCPPNVLDLFTSFSDYLKQEVSRLVEARLEALLESDLDSLHERFKSNVVGIVRDCQEEAVAKYQRKY